MSDEDKYILKDIQNSREASALFFNKVQKAYRGNKVEKVQPNEQIKNNFDEVIYEYNSLGYRSDEFIKNHDSKHILFAGCSETEGCGGNLEACWAYMLYEKVKDPNSKFFNLGRAGWGWQLIISNIMEYIKEYGKPDNIFILFPNIGRFLSWTSTEDDKEVFRQEMYFPHGTGELDTDNVIIREKLTVEQQRNLLINFCLTMKIFEEYCNSNNIKLIWSTWDQYDSENYDKLKIFNNFIVLQNQYDYIKNNKEFFVEKIEHRKDWLRKRDGHQGYLNHFVWAEGFYNALTKKFF